MAGFLTIDIQELFFSDFGGARVEHLSHEFCFGNQKGLQSDPSFETPN
jgi:hypothetical protein